MKKNIVFKIGGSVIYDKALNINEEFLGKLKVWYSSVQKEYQKIVLVVGGGSPSRELQEKIAASVGGEKYLHSIGMSVTTTNANLVKAYLEDEKIYIPTKLGDAYEFLISDGEKRIVSGGLNIGWSTDMNAALYADIMEVKRIYKISNVDYIYDKDPNLSDDAKPIKEMSWDDYFELFNIQEDSAHTPNSSIPVDVACARFCNHKGISIWFTGGEKITQEETIENVLESGTLVHP